MEIVRESFCVPSCDGVHTLAGVVFRPTGQIRGFFHVVHGMTEYIGRYERFMTAMAEAGYLTFGYDNLGHGNTGDPTNDLGFIATRGGWELLIRDVRVFSDAVFKTYGKTAELPYLLMGHSMGSFIARLAAARTVKADKLIAMGTGGPNPAANPGLGLIALIQCFYGARHISPLLQKVAFGNYNKRFEKELEDAPDPWLTTDAEIRKKYAGDPFCTFKFTVSAMGDLIRLMKYSNQSAWYETLPVSTPVLLVSGEDDPVGNYGVGVRQVTERLARSGHNVSCVLYPGGRHEILNDVTYDATVQDILAFAGE